MAITTIQATPSPPAAKQSSTTEIQKAAAAKVNAQAQKPESVQAPAKTPTPPAKVENTNNQPAAEAPKPVVNTSGQVTGTTINTTA